MQTNFPELDLLFKKSRHRVQEAKERRTNGTIEGDGFGEIGSHAQVVGTKIESTLAEMRQSFLSSRIFLVILLRKW